MTSKPIIRDTELHKLLLRGRRYTLENRQIIQSTDDRQVVNLVVSGFFRKYLIDNDGNIGVQIVYGPGDIFPITLVYRKLFNQKLYNGRETFFYEAMTDAVVHSIDADQLADAVKQNLQLYQDILQEAGRHLEYCIYSLENLSLKNSEKRIAHLLWYFAKRFSISGGGEVRIEAPLTHQSIGEILNITRETVTTQIKKLRQKKLIKAGKFITIPDLEKLEEDVYS